jgi:hypothetical protein
MKMTYLQHKECDLKMKRLWRLNIGVVVMLDVFSWTLLVLHDGVDFFETVAN